jgi:hypothetical protein
VNLGLPNSAAAVVVDSILPLIQQQLLTNHPQKRGEVDTTLILKTTKAMPCLIRKPGIAAPGNGG